MTPSTSLLRTVLAAALTLSLSAPLFAQSYGEGEYWANRYEQDMKATLNQAKEERAARAAEAAKAAQDAKAAEPTGMCAQNPQLNEKGFMFALKSKDGDAKKDLAISFFWPSCKNVGVESTSDRPGTGRAVRVYGGDQAGYQLQIETQDGSEYSTVSIIENWNGTPKVAASFGLIGNKELLGAIALGPVTVTDTRYGAKDRHEGKAAMKSADFGKPNTEPLTGCQ